MSQDSTDIRNIKKSSVDKAIELITKHNVAKKRPRNLDKDANDKVANYCKNYQRKSRTSVVGFSKSLVLSEMQSCIVRQDWKQATNLFLRLLKYPVELEPLIWRYLLIILLHTHDPSHLREFFEQCIGNQSSNNGILLKRLLLLPLQE